MFDNQSAVPLLVWLSFVALIYFGFLHVCFSRKLAAAAAQPMATGDGKYVFKGRVTIGDKKQ